MKPHRPPLLLTFLWLWLAAAGAGSARAEDPVAVAEVVAVSGSAELLRAGASTWDSARSGQTNFGGDRLRTGERGRISLRLLRDGSIVHLGELTEMQLDTKPASTVLRVLQGVMSFFHRGKSGSLEVQTGVTAALIRGTEFAYAVAGDGTIRLTLIEGEVELSNPQGTLEMRGTERATVEPGGPPRRTAMLAEGPVEAIQWQLYYPAVLDPEELDLPTDIRAALSDVLQRYREGDLLGALAAYPSGREPVDAREQVLLAALVLSVGNVTEAERHLSGLPNESRVQRLAAALRQLIAAAQLRPCPEDVSSSPPVLATEWMARSYCRQAQRDLEGAREAAREAVAIGPESGFAWARWAALEFGFGRIRDAQSALDRALTLSPKNAAAITAGGFLAAARYQFERARMEFDRAQALDPWLADAWLGRGLVEMRQGQTEAGLADLTVAAATEPLRGVLRSYLGRAFAVDHQVQLARREFDLAERLDSEDPTVWLFRGLLLQQESQINDAIRSLNTAEALTEERALFRSRWLLEQDRAVAGANRATAYQDGGLEEIARREAGRALSLDAANPSAHRFLADSYATTERVNLRYESARAAEYLQANLLAPVGAGPLSAALSEQDYTPLFEEDRPHVFSVTSYQEVGGWQQSGGVYGTAGRLGYAVDAYYANGDLGFPNTDFEQTAIEAQAKVQATDRDSFYVQMLENWFTSGDLATYADPMNINPDLHVEERLNPVLVAGWHRAWTPEQHTLVLAAWLDADQHVQDTTSSTWLTSPEPISGILVFPTSLDYRSESSWLSLEAQHIWQTPINTLIVGVRFQDARIEAVNDFGRLDPLLRPPDTRVDSDGQRTQLYAYDTWRVTDSLALTAGLSADWLSYPLNFRSGPLTTGDEDVSQVSPKAGVVWQPRTNLWLRGAYTRSLGGIGPEQSIRLEPTQVAGFNQTYRSLIPESVAGSISGAEIETGDAAIEWQWRSGTLFGLQGQWLRSEATGFLGAYGVVAGPINSIEPVRLAQDLEFTDQSLTAYVGQLLGRDWTVFLRYRLGQVDYDESYPGIAPDALINFDEPFLAHRESTVTTQAVTLSGRFNHPSGWFAGADATWTHQTSDGYLALPAENLWMVNVFAGRRFWQRRVEVTVGIENLANQDYQLNPLTLIAAPPRERSFFAQLKWTY